MEWIFFFILIYFLLLLLSGYLLYKLYRWFERNRYHKAGIIILCTIVLSVIYFVYTAIYPTDDFYKDEFKYYFKTDFPASGEILDKDASYPDFHGDYVAAFVMTVNQKDYSNLINKFRSDKRYTIDKSLVRGSKQLDNISSEFEQDKQVISFSCLEEEHDLSIGFYKDNKIVVHIVNF